MRSHPRRRTLRSPLAPWSERFCYRLLGLMQGTFGIADAICQEIGRPSFRRSALQELHGTGGVPSGKLGFPECDQSARESPRVAELRSSTPTRTGSSAPWSCSTA
jgi:hypothetical protein